MKQDFPIKGLKYQPNFLSEPEAWQSVQVIDASEWSTNLARKVQHYGLEYDYRSRSISDASLIQPLPRWAQALRDKIFNTGELPFLHDQVIVNEYLKNQGISAHTDCEPCFMDHIACISLLEPWEMKFYNFYSKEKFSLVLEPMSLLILSGEARYNWTHEIPKRLKEPSGIIRERRLSLTFRKIKTHS